MKGKSAAAILLVPTMLAFGPVARKDEDAYYSDPESPSMTEWQEDECLANITDGVSKTSCTVTDSFTFKVSIPKSGTRRRSLDENGVSRSNALKLDVFVLQNKAATSTNGNGLAGSTHGHSLDGGYYDAGDYVKFGFPMVYIQEVTAEGLKWQHDDVHGDGQVKTGVCSQPETYAVVSTFLLRYTFDCPVDFGFSGVNTVSVTVRPAPASVPRRARHFFTPKKPTAPAEPKPASAVISTILTIASVVARLIA